MATNYPPSVAGLRMSARWVYRELSGAPSNQLTKDELEAILACDRSTINRAVDELEDAGVAEIVCSRHDVQQQAVRLL